MADFFAKGNKPISGYGGADHGIYELWKNANIGTSFAGQSIQITNFDSDKIDAIVVAVEMILDENYGVQWFEFDKDVLNVPQYAGNMTVVFLDSSNSKCNMLSRFVKFSLSGTTLTITFLDGQVTTQNAIGSSATVSTDNRRLVPVRILGIIHND